jgi:hypothetical protein
MWKAAYVASAIVLGATLAAWPREARAAGPIDIEGGGVGGAATNPSHGPSPFGGGVGMRAGAGYEGLYLGLALTHYFGDSGELHAGKTEAAVKQGSALYGADLGYTFAFTSGKYLKLRPILQLGDVQITRSGSLSSQELTGNYSGFYLQPGFVALLTVNAFYVGVDVGLLIVPGASDLEGVTENAADTASLVTSRRSLAAFTSHGQLGFRF